MIKSLRTLRNHRACVLRPFIDLHFRDKLQKQPGFTEGTFDIDNLCSELRAKAKCSESGVVVDQKDVDEALKRLPQRV